MEYAPPPPKAPDVPVMNSEQIAKQVIASMPKPTAQKTENKEKSTPVQQSPDMIYQFLTQDVSERRIAHIVTGGIGDRGREDLIPHQKRQDTQDYDRLKD